MTSPICIIIVDDHEMVRKGVRAYLETLPDFEVVGEAVTGEEALTLVSELIPDIVLLDLILPDMDGVEVIRRVKQISPRTQIVVLTSYYKEAHNFSALKAGAISYVLKDMKMEKLADALRCAAQGEVMLNPSVAVQMLQNICSEEGGERLFCTELTNRELEVLKLISNGLTNNQIAEELVLKENMVNGHVSNIVSKLYFAAQTQAAVYAWPHE